MRDSTARPHPGTAVTSASSPSPSPSADLNRRRFLVALGAGGAGVAAAVASLPAAAGVVAPAVQPDVAEPGYRETTHVRDYYRTCKI